MDDLPAWEAPKVLALQGEARCTAGDRQAGLALLMDALARTERIGWFKFDPDAARMRAEAGLCALTLGKWKLARQLAERSRAAFAGDPMIGPYYQAPLKRLQAALADGRINS